ncbi:MAG: hypothetical protein F6K24_18915 [Okeania sp. SIO2D1]|nr:hypothetical protein [Okeania sp. SIO2D1]
MAENVVDSESEIGFVITGTAKRKSKAALKAFEKHLKRIAYDVGFTIVDIDEG